MKQMIMQTVISWSITHFLIVYKQRTVKSLNCNWHDLLVIVVALSGVYKALVAMHIELDLFDIFRNWIAKNFRCELRVLSHRLIRSVELDDQITRLQIICQDLEVVHHLDHLVLLCHNIILSGFSRSDRFKHVRELHLLVSVHSTEALFPPWF